MRRGLFFVGILWAGIALMVGIYMLIIALRPNADPAEVVFLTLCAAGLSVVAFSIGVDPNS